jgi:hypothetical protein
MRQDQRESFRLLADRTGGKAFYGTNDISAAIISAFGDSRFTYTLGFYPSHGAWDGKFRELKIKVPVEGVHLRYRRGYFALPERSDGPAVNMIADLQEASRSPLDATNLGVSVRGKALPPSPSPRVVHSRSLLTPNSFFSATRIIAAAVAWTCCFCKKIPQAIPFPPKFSTSTSILNRKNTISFPRPV